MESLKFELKGKAGSPVDFDDFSDFSRNLSEALRRVFRATDSKSRQPKYHVSRLEIGSVLCSISATADSASLGSFVQCVEAIRNKQRPPINLTNEDVRSFKRLAEPLKKSTESIQIEEVPLDVRFVDGCDWLITNAPKSVGQTIGRLEGVNIHARKFFRIYPEGIDRGSECFYPDNLHEKVISLIGKRVRVEGVVHRDPDGVGVDRITDIKTIELIAENSDLPKLSDLFGLFKNKPVDVAAGWEG